MRKTRIAHPASLIPDSFMSAPSRTDAQQRADEIRTFTEELARGRPHVTIKAKAANTVHEGGRKPSRLVVPVIAR